MDRTTALGAAAGVTLAVVGAVSALFFTINQPDQAAAVEEAPITVEYVDAYGNPAVDPTTAPATSPQVVLLNADGTAYDTVAAQPPAELASDPAASTAEEYETEEYEEGEFEEGDHEEYETEEHEEDDHDEYENDEYETEEYETEEYEEDEEDDHDEDEDDDDD